MPATRTLADIWLSELTVEERLLVFLDRFGAAVPQPPTSMRLTGYADCVADIRHFVLDSRPLPPVGFL